MKIVIIFVHIKMANILFHWSISELVLIKMRVFFLFLSFSGIKNVFFFSGSLGLSLEVRYRDRKVGKHAFLVAGFLWGKDQTADISSPTDRNIPSAATANSPSFLLLTVRRHLCFTASCRLYRITFVDINSSYTRIHLVLHYTIWIFH